MAHPINTNKGAQPAAAAAAPAPKEPVKETFASRLVKDFGFLGMNTLGMKFKDVHPTLSILDALDKGVQIDATTQAKIIAYCKRKSEESQAGQHAPAAHVVLGAAAASYKQKQAKPVNSAAAAAAAPEANAAAANKKLVAALTTTTGTTTTTTVTHTTTAVDLERAKRLNVLKPEEHDLYSLPAGAYAGVRKDGSRGFFAPKKITTTTTVQTTQGTTKADTEALLAAQRAKILAAKTSGK